MTENSGEKNWFEWSVFAVGLTLILGTVGTLCFDLISRGTPTPPNIAVRIGRAEQREHHYAVQVTVENSGDETAEAVHIEATFQPAGGGPTEVSGFQIQFLPGHGKREGWVTFGNDPATGTLRARPLGYQIP